MAKLSLKEIDPAFTEALDKESAEEMTAAYLQKMYHLLYRMFAENKTSLLINLHGIDTSGKDGTISHIFSGANPQGVNVYSFKQPSEEELRHDFLWRCHIRCPEAGTTAIFNRSYYEEVTTVKVHPKKLLTEHLPLNDINQKDFFEKRYVQINNFEKMLVENGTTVVKIFLHISKAEQKRRLRERLRDSTKNWKFSKSDVKERKHWGSYMKAFDQMLAATNTSHAPWHIIPADKKWYRNYLTSQIIVDRLSEMHLKFPKLKKTKNVKISG